MKKKVVRILAFLYAFLMVVSVCLTFKLFDDETTNTSRDHNIRVPISENKNLTTADLFVNDSPRDQLVSVGVGKPNKIKYWRYDDASPKIHHAKTHYLSSVPNHHRFLFHYESHTRPMKSLDRYWSETNYIPTPNSAPLFETNPSIAKLPRSYVSHWMQQKPSLSLQGLPVYVSTYRVVHAPVGKNKLPKADFLGVALLDENLDVLIDTVVTMKTFFRRYQDFRVLNLRSVNVSLEEELYLTSYEYISPIQLVLASKDEPVVRPKSFAEVPTTFPFRSTGTSSDLVLRIFIRNWVTCVPSLNNKRTTIKNLLYFTDEYNNTKVWFHPRPNSVLPIHTNEQCFGRKMTDPKDIPNRAEVLPDPSFHTIEQSPSHRDANDVFSRDRGSACCTRIPKNQITSRTFETIVDNDHLLVAIVHSKKTTGYVYMSRFIAFLPYKPYSIVARSGMFCFGTSRKEEVPNRYPWAAVVELLKFGNYTLNCPQIHFVTGMTDKVVVKLNATNIDNTAAIATEEVPDLEDSVVISYGIQDKFSRFVEVKKSTIATMLSDNMVHDI